MTRTVCDICGKEMTTAKFADAIEDLNFCISSHGKIWDICTECGASLNRWMTIRRQQADSFVIKIPEGISFRQWLFDNHGMTEYEFDSSTTAYGKKFFHNQYLKYLSERNAITTGKAIGVAE